jgi:predicted nucleic acid-binding protein
MNAVDTNILFYAHDPRDLAKQEVALSLIDSLDDGALLWQVANEFLWSSRKLEPLGFPASRAWVEIRELRRSWATILPTWTTMDLAGELLSKYSLSFWDAMIVAACLEGGVNCLYTEDLGGQPRIGTLEIVNPFNGP